MNLLALALLPARTSLTLLAVLLAVVLVLAAPRLGLAVWRELAGYWKWRKFVAGAAAVMALTQAQYPFAEGAYAMPVRKGTSWLAMAGLPALAAGTAADTSAFTSYWFNPTLVGVYDPEVEYALQLWVTFEATVTGVATNNFAIVVTHYNSVGAVVDQCTLTFASGVNATAFVGIDLTTNASVVVNSGAKPGNWLMAPGDLINVKRASNGTGLASPAFGLGVVFGRKA